MRVTLFTSNNFRHNYLINYLSNFCDELFVVQECKPLFVEIKNEEIQSLNVIEKYFKKVNEAQNKIFKKELVNKNNKNIKILSIIYGELNNISLSDLGEFTKSDIYIVFGSSFIKGNLIDFLIKKKAINIHAGVSPYYRGTACNFWALYDGNSHLVGATIHLLSKGLDSGPILYHAMSNIKSDHFEYTMSTVKSAFHSIGERIRDKSIFKIEPDFQDKKKEIRYSKSKEFNEQIVIEYYKKKIDLNNINFDRSLLKEPFFL